MSSVIFIWYVITGVIVPTDDVDGRKIYTIETDKGVIEYAYKGEILNYIESGSFVYNEDLED
jgi:hypothetical protein